MEYYKHICDRCKTNFIPGVLYNIKSIIWGELDRIEYTKCIKCGTLGISGKASISTKAYYSDVRHDLTRVWSWEDILRSYTEELP